MARGEGRGGTRHRVGKDPCVDTSGDIPTDRGVQPGRSSADVDSIRSPSISHTYEYIFEEPRSNECSNFIAPPILSIRRERNNSAGGIT